MKAILCQVLGGPEDLVLADLPEPDPGEGEVLVRVLRHTDGNQLRAARILGITRGSLRNKIRALGISIARSVWSDDEQGDG